MQVKKVLTIAIIAFATVWLTDMIQKTLSEGTHIPSPLISPLAAATVAVMLYWAMRRKED